MYLSSPSYTDMTREREHKRDKMRIRASFKCPVYVSLEETITSLRNRIKLLEEKSSSKVETKEPKKGETYFTYNCRHCGYLYKNNDLDPESRDRCRECEVAPFNYCQYRETHM